MLERLFRRFYALNERENSSCELVVPLGYGLLFEGELPNASKKTLLEAVKIAVEQEAQIVFTSSNYFWPGCKKQENKIKLEMIAETVGPTLASQTLIARNGATNTVTEAKAIRGTLVDAGFNLHTRIIVIADWRHARSTRWVWRRVFPESEIIVRSVDGQWNENHPALFQRSNERWTLINLIRHVGLIFCSDDIVGRFRHPIAKKGAQE